MYFLCCCWFHILSIILCQNLFPLNILIDNRLNLINNEFSNFV